MDEIKGKAPDSFGGKTIGSVGGALTAYISTVTPEGSPFKDILLYASPIVAVWVKDFGGVVLYEIKLSVVDFLKELKLARVKKRIDNIPDHPDFAEMKKDVSKEYMAAMGDIIKENIESVRQLSRLTEDKEVKDKVVQDRAPL